MNFQSEKDLQNSKICIFYIMDITRDACARAKTAIFFHFFSCENLALAEDPTSSQFFRHTNSPAFLCPKLYPTPCHARNIASLQF